MSRDRAHHGLFGNGHDIGFEQQQQVARPFGVEAGARFLDQAPIFGAAGGRGGGGDLRLGKDRRDLRMGAQQRQRLRFHPRALGGGKALVEIEVA